jgi:hypothetical protein
MHELRFRFKILYLFILEVKFLSLNYSKKKIRLMFEFIVVLDLVPLK